LTESHEVQLDPGAEHLAQSYAVHEEHIGEVGYVILS